ncbi:MAG: cytochrome b N-terminal domain-containing protein [Xanthomonadales bacterium]|nr:Na(+)-translocating NADH-quinone reductase subunit F [Xanthomonadales bacterium]MCC6592266.1 cytochrome b N-terminal domain-containing protein [Xanthomonadales bacterium]MCE7930668.1 ferredoxin-NAD reductase [Xanthomonadales bacterium PRO6]
MSGPLQRALRAAFLRIEGAFNHAFGERLNPWYHLGSLGWWLYWIVAVSGLYLYAFFDTSVAGAHASAQGLTDSWIGGPLRSLHRYAADGLLVVLVVHAWRHYAHDRLRGFRAYSWWTGVILFGLAYAAGVNGYMLPWDRLAQFVTVAGFEWLDWLPMFGGVLGRNTIDAASVTDRLFSLLVFIHIGVPLLALLLLWAHVQRVPKARTQPPRALAAASLASLLALSLVLPVASQGGPAELGSEPMRLALDWFYLGPFPLLYRIGAGPLWALVIGLTLLLLVLPWLRRPASGQQRFQVVLHASAVPGATRDARAAATRHLLARPGETLLDAGLRAGLALPYDCRNGGCRVCVATLLNGRVDPGPFQEAALDAGARARGEVLMCCACALEDVELDVPVPDLGASQTQAPRERVARVARLERLAETVMQVELELLDGAPIDYAAGQYLEILLADGARRAYSFASAPGSGPLIELHIRRQPGGLYSTHVFERMQVGERVRLLAPLGHFTLHAGTRPILMVAGATGFAPVKSLIEDAFARGVKRQIALYWGVRHPRDFYLPELLSRWQRERPNFSVVQVVSEPESAPEWQGRTGLVHEALLEDYPQLAACEVYACGSMQMVQQILPVLRAHGLPEDACYSDAFVAASG